MSSQNLSGSAGYAGRTADMVRDIESALEAVFASERKNGAAERLVAAMAYATLGGGKRIRGCLVLATARMLACERGGADRPSRDMGATRIAAAYECLHAYSLIHDDLPVMDDAETRRGRLSCHRQFDEATAILAGDALQTLAFGLLVAPDTHRDAELRALLALDLAEAAGAAGMAGGQMLDLEAADSSFDLTMTGRMQAMKTGALIRAAVVAGGRISMADDRTLAALGHFGATLGKAFQIADDLLDVSGDAGLTGKPVGRDQGQSKATLVGHLGVDAAGREAEKQIAEAKRTLDGIATKGNPWLDYLKAMSDFVVDRKG